MIIYIVSVLGACLILIAALTFIQHKKRHAGKRKKIPGPGPSHSQKGNREDIKNMGSLSYYMNELRRKYGPIASFWDGSKMAVAISSPELVTEFSHITNQPGTLNEIYRPLLGSASLPFQNGMEGKKRRYTYDHFLSISGCETYYQIFTEVAEECVKKWKKYSLQDQIPLVSSMRRIVMKSILRTAVGDYFKNEEDLENFIKEFSFIIETLQKRPKPESDEYQKMTKSIKNVRESVQRIIDARTDAKNEHTNVVFVDALIQEDASEEQKISDILTLIMVGYETVAKLLIWTICELCNHQDVQDKVYHELNTVLGDEAVTEESLEKLTYLRQAIDETLRLRIVVDYTARVTQGDMTVAGYFIPKGTDIYQSIGTIHHDPELWPQPEKFDPDRFSPENCRKHHSHAFKPFGFGGSRRCPGTTYAYVEISILLSYFLRNFRLELVPDQNCKVYIYPESLNEENWIVVHHRKTTSQRDWNRF